MPRPPTQLVLRATFGIVLFVYTIAALAVSGTRAMPIVAVELVLLSYTALLYSRRHNIRLPRWPTPSMPAQPELRALLLAAVLLFHVVVVALLGAFTAERWLPVLGLGVLVAGCYFGSCNRHAVRWRTVGTALAMQFWLAILMLRLPVGMDAIGSVACGAQALLFHANAGASFVFGPAVATVWAFKVLPITIFFSSFCSVLLHLNVLQAVFGEVGGALAKVLGTSRAEAVCAVSNVFLGQTEAPLVLRPIIGRLTPSQLHCVMTGGFASVAGSTLGAYILMGVPATHLLAASVLSAPAALATSKLLHPDPPPPPPRARPPARRREPADDCACGSAHATPPTAAHRIGARSAGTDGVTLMGLPSGGSGGLPREVVPSVGAVDAEAAFAARRFETDTPPPTPAARAAARADEVDEMEEGAERAEGDEGTDVDVAPPPDELPRSTSESVVQAAAEGAINAVPLTACIATTLIAFLALISLLDSWVGYLGALVGVTNLSFTRILGWLFYPVALLMGVPTAECVFVGELLGIKMAANEFVAYARLGAAIEAGTVSRRALVIASYALCGFANLGSMGIMVGGLSILAPQKREVLCQEVMRALVAGTLACFATACVAGAVYDVDAEGAGGAGNVSTC